MQLGDDQKNGKNTSLLKKALFVAIIIVIIPIGCYLLLAIIETIVGISNPPSQNVTPKSQPTEVATISATPTIKPKPTVKPTASPKPKPTIKSTPSPKPIPEPTVNQSEVRFYKRQAIQAYLQPIMNDLSRTHEAVLSMQVAGASGDLYAVKSRCEDGAQAAKDAELEASTGTVPDDFEGIRRVLISGAMDLKIALFACQNALEGNGMSRKELIENQGNMDDGNNDIKIAIENARQKYVELGGLANDVPDIR